ncbi:MAG TPA: ABC transporter ATP-binding protein [Mucilaginibacter sp.]|nr:ABC transporter ATP-binding protein [Mucilaginibacter sp.]
MLRSILGVLDQKERAKMFLLIFWDIVISALDIIFLGLTVLVINFYVQGSASKYVSFLPAKLNDKNSVLLIAVFFVLFGIKNLSAYRVSASEYGFIYQVASRLSRRNMYDYLRSGYMQYVNVDSSVHIRKISQQPIEFSTYILTNFQQIISQSVLVLFTVCAVLWYHASLFVLLFLLLMPAVSILGWILKTRLKAVRTNIKKTGEETLKTLHEALASYIESNIYHRNDFFAERYYHQQERLNHNIKVQQTLQALPSRLIEIFAILGFFILIVLNKLAGSNAPVDLLTIGVFLAAAYKIIPGVVKILNSAGQMRTYEFTIRDLQASDTIHEETSASSITQIRSINIDKIYFSYNHKPLLHGLNAEIQPGDFIGISSDSGKGKTTFINILLGFLSQEEGIISINNKITNCSDRKNYRNRISYIKQQPFFIHDTIARNITLTENDFDANKLDEVIDFCDLDVIIGQHPEGLEWIITENGKNLSGGQRQRMVLARALYHGFDLLILDEPFGELDQLSENIILEKLQMLAAEGKMILFVTHNRQSLSYCNKLVSLDE